MFRLTMFTMVFATFAVTGCASDPGQTITGRARAATFPEPITHVRAVGNTSTVEARVAADGSFAITLPAGERYRIEMVSAVRASDLVFPRPTTGTFDTSFYIADSGAAFDLGGVQYAKDADGDGVSEDGAIAEHSPDAVLNGDGEGGGGGEGDSGGGGQDTGGGGQDTGGGGQDTGGGGQDTGGGGGG